MRIFLIFHVWLTSMAHSLSNQTYTLSLWTDHPETNTAVELAIQAVNQDPAWPFNFSLSSVSVLSPVSVLSAYEVSRQHPIVGIIGPFSTEMTLVAAALASRDNIPLVSPTVTSASMDLRYPKSYSSLFRTTPDNSQLAGTVSALVSHFDWTLIGIIRDLSASALDGTAQNEFLTGLQEQGRVIIARECDSPVSCRAALDFLLKRFVFVFVVWSFSSPASVIFKEALMLDLFKPGYVWISVEGTQSAVELVDREIRGGLAGLFSLEPLRDNPGAVVDLRARWLSFRPSTFPPNNYLETQVLNAYDAVFAISHALKQAYMDANNVLVPSAPTSMVNWTQGSDVIAALHQVNFTGLLGQLSFSNQRVKRGFDVYNYQGIAGQSRCRSAHLFT